MIVYEAAIHRSSNEVDVTIIDKRMSSLKIFIYSGFGNKLLQLLLIYFHFASASAAL